ncbi:hypothetical protein Ndes2526B_g08889 [Nannochloris sp. 'desiccata']
MAVQLTEAAKNKLHALGILPYDSDKAKTTYMLPQNEEGWAYERKIRCTASDIGMVAGQSDRGDAAVALHRKFNPLPPSPAMAVALRLEPIIANNYVNQLKEETNNNVNLDKVGLLIHPSHPYLAASLNYFQTEPEPCIVQMKFWKEFPEVVPRDTELQVIMQLAIAAESEHIQWGRSMPKAVVVAVNPDSIDFCKYNIEWDAQAKKTWEEDILPKATLFYEHGVLPKLSPLHSTVPLSSPLHTMPSLAATPSRNTNTSTLEEEVIMQDTPVISPGIAKGKEVYHPKMGRFGTVAKVLPGSNDLCINWFGDGDNGDNSKRHKPCAPDKVVVLPKPRSDWVKPTQNGQRVLVCAGAVDKVGLKGVITQWNPLKCSIKSEIGEIFRVNTEFLHVEHGEQPVEQPSSTVSLKRGNVSTHGFKQWLLDFEHENNVKLVLHRVNDTCSRILMEEKLEEAIELAKYIKKRAGGAAAGDDETGAETLLQLKNPK